MYEHSRYGDDPKRDPSVRASDQDRENTADRLRRSHAEGRLDVEEFQQRLDRCYESKTLGELEQLVTDLPGEHVDERRLRFRRLPRVGLVPILIAAVVLCSAIGPHDHHGYWGLWFVIPMFFLARFVFWPYRWRRWRDPGRAL